MLRRGGPLWSIKPGLPPWEPHVRFRRMQTLVREGSPLVRLRPTRGVARGRARRSSRISNCRTGWGARRERGLMRWSSARCRTIARSTRTPGGTTGFGRLIHYRDVFDKRSWTRLSPAPPPPGDLVLPAISAERPHRSGHFPRAILVRQNLYARSDKALYEHHRRGGYAGREQAWAQQEADILRAAAEGRVLNPDNITK